MPEVRAAPSDGQSLRLGRGGYNKKSRDSGRGGGGLAQPERPLPIAQFLTQDQIAARGKFPSPGRVFRDQRVVAHPLGTLKSRVFHEEKGEFLTGPRCDPISRAASPPGADPSL